MDDKTQTQNVPREKFGRVEPQPSFTNTDTTQGGKGSAIRDNIGVFADFYSKIKEDIPFALSFIAIVGYIVIAGFGHIKSWSDLVRYLMLLLVSVLVYKSMGLERIHLSSWLPWVIAGVFLTALVIENYAVIVSIL